MIDDPKDIQPMHNLVLIYEFHADTGSRLVTPDTTSGSEFYEVISVGPGMILPDGKRARPIPRPGDVVVIGGVISGHTIVAGGKIYRLLSDEFVVARVGTVLTMKRRDESGRIVIPEAPRLQ